MNVNTLTGNEIPALFGGLDKTGRICFSETKSPREENSAFSLLPAESLNCIANDTKCETLTVKLTRICITVSAACFRTETRRQCSSIPQKLQLATHYQCAPFCSGSPASVESVRPCVRPVQRANCETFRRSQGGDA